MTEETKTPEQIAAEAAAVAQDTFAEKPAPEGAKDPAALSSLAAAAAVAASESPEQTAADANEDDSLAPEVTAGSPHALRGIQAGPAPHPRSVHHRKTHPVPED